MNPILRNVLAVLGGLAAGSIVNMGLVDVGGKVFPAPEGEDMSTLEGIRAAIPHMTLPHFLVPLLAHALGTLAGAFVTALLATRKLPLAMLIGALFLLGGIAMVSMVGGPIWFIICDLGIAYLPMAWLGAQLGMQLTKR